MSGDTPGLAYGRALIHEERRAVRASRVEDVEWLVRSGEGTRQIAARMGLAPRSLYRMLLRAGRPELWQRARLAEGYEREKHGLRRTR